MRICPECNKQYEDDVLICPECGVDTEVIPSGETEETPKEEKKEPETDKTGKEKKDKKEKKKSPFDHSDEFGADDISDHKVVAMILYLLGPLGLIIALLAGADSPYTRFHIRESLKLTVVGALITIASAVLEFAAVIILWPVRLITGFIPVDWLVTLLKILTDLAAGCVPFVGGILLAVIAIVVFINF